MHAAFPPRRGPAPPAAGRGRSARFGRWAAWLLATLLLACATALPAAGAEIDLTAFDVAQTDEGVLLDYSVAFDLSHSVEEALAKAVPLFFMAEASIFRSRWYWRDRRAAHAVRIWRIVYQPLTSTYRVTFGGLSQNYATRAEALAAISRSARWKIAEPGQLEEGSSHYVEFSFRLDTSQLPRPMQIGIGGQPEWNLSAERKQRLP